MTDLTKLAERVEALDGPSRELDAEIAREFGFIVCAEPDRAHPRMYGGDIPKRNKRNLPAFTASIDAALTLVPDTTDITVGRVWCVRRYAHITDGGKTWSGEAGTEALALVAAALRAKDQADV